MTTTPFYQSTFNTDLSETVAYNNPLFPVYVRRGLLSYYPDYSAISHWHDDLEFLVVTKGTLTYNVNGQLIEIPAGSGICVNSRQLHYGFSPERKECEFLCILLSPTLLQGNAWFYNNCVMRITANTAMPYLYLDGGSDRTIIDWLEQIDRDYEPADADSCIEVVALFLSICREINARMPAAQGPALPTSEALVSVRNMVTYIDDHYMEHIALTDVAAAGRCCKSKCDTLFKTYLHDTPITYITKVRLRKSLTPLIETDHSISEIAYSHGFSGTSYYCETFRKYYQLSPSQYRRHYRDSQPSSPASSPDALPLHPAIRLSG